MEISKRIVTLIEILGLSPSEFADQIGVQRSGISHITSGRNKPSLDFLENTLITFPDINPEWLILGKGKPLKSMEKTIILDPDAEIDNSKKAPLPAYPDLFSNEENFTEPQKEEIVEKKTIENIPLKEEINNDKKLDSKIKKVIILYENGKFESYEQ